MRESILTIPINEIFEPKEGCPICRMRNMLESRAVEYIMGAAMMEPDVRQETNRLGFCRVHLAQMQQQKNRLSLALMLQTRLEELQKEGFPKKLAEENKKLFHKKAEDQKISLARCQESCFVCDKTDWGMERLTTTFFQMIPQPEFRRLFQEQDFVCFPHFELLCRLAPSRLPKQALSNFYSDLKTLTQKALDTLYSDVSHYCSMYDYRNSGKDADWGNSKDSIERAIPFLTSRE